MHLQTHDGCGEAIATIVCASENAEQVEEIAKIKMNDLNARDLDQACRIIAGTARSSGITVED